MRNMHVCKQCALSVSLHTRCSNCFNGSVVSELLTEALKGNADVSAL